jgi:hypothetical protein
VQEAAEHVAPEGVGPEQRVRRRAAVRRGHELGRRVRRDERPEQGDGDHQPDDDQPDARAPDLQRAAQGPQPGVPAQALGDGGLGPDGGARLELDRALDRRPGGHRPAVLRRGVTRIVATSASRFRPT